MIKMLTIHFTNWLLQIPFYLATDKIIAIAGSVSRSPLFCIPIEEKDEE